MTMPAIIAMGCPVSTPIPTIPPPTAAHVDGSLILLFIHFMLISLTVDVFSTANSAAHAFGLA